MAASIDSVNRLHTAVVDKLADAIEAMEPGDKGLAAILNVARQLCKDSGVEATAPPGSPVGKLADKLKQYPFDPTTDAVN